MLVTGALRYAKVIVHKYVHKFWQLHIVELEAGVAG